MPEGIFGCVLLTKCGCIERGGVVVHGAAGKLISHRSTQAEVQAAHSRALASGTAPALNIVLEVSMKAANTSSKNGHLLAPICKGLVLIALDPESTGFVFIQTPAAALTH